MDQLVDYLPADISTFRDIFCGSGVVSLNVNARNYRLTDIQPQLIELHNGLMDMQFCMEALDDFNYYPYDTETYYELRADYNESPTTSKFLNLIYRSFSNQMRFNAKGEFNLPCGKRNIFDWNRIMKHYSYVKGSNFVVENSEFRTELLSCNDDDVVFLDPPYYNSVATYNSGWNEQDEHDLYELVGNLKCKWIMTNTLENRGVVNPHLTKFVKGYNVHPIKSSFTYDNFRKTDSVKREVIVTNYKV